MVRGNFNTWEELLSRQSVQVLILANMVPLFGVLLWNWSLFSIMFLYWFENVIIGLFNALKMYRAEGPIEQTQNAKLNGTPYTRTSKMALIAFFCVHYGIFTIVHGAFVAFSFGPFPANMDTILYGICAILISHAISYFVNFIGNEEYKRVSETTLFIQPYKRAVLLHINVLFGAFLVQLLGAPVVGLIFFIFLKTSIDIWAHTREHNGLAKIENTLLDTASTPYASTSHSQSSS